VNAVPEPLPTDAVILTSNQKVIFQQLREFREESSRRTVRSALEPLYFPASLSPRERHFIKRICHELCLNTDITDGTFSFPAFFFYWAG